MQNNSREIKNEDQNLKVKYSFIDLAQTDFDNLVCNKNYIRDFEGIIYIMSQDNEINLQKIEKYQ